MVARQLSALLVNTVAFGEILILETAGDLLSIVTFVLADPFREQSLGGCRTGNHIHWHR